MLHQNKPKAALVDLAHRMVGRYSCRWPWAGLCHFTEQRGAQQFETFPLSLKAPSNRKEGAIARAGTDLFFQMCCPRLLQSEVVCCRHSDVCAEQSPDLSTWGQKLAFANVPKGRVHLACQDISVLAVHLTSVGKGTATSSGSCEVHRARPFARPGASASDQHLPGEELCTSASTTHLVLGCFTEGFHPKAALQSGMAF